MKDPATEKQTRPLRDLVETVFRHRRKAVAFFVAVTVSALIILAFTPVTYTSTSKLIVHRGRESVFVDPTSGGTSLPLYKEWESEINTELEILNSRELVAQVVESMGASAFLEERPPDETGRLGPVRKFFNPVRLFFRRITAALPGRSDKQDGRRLKKVNKAVQIVEKGLEIGVRPKSDIIIVSYTAQDPELARQVVDELVRNYLERRIDLHQIPGGYQFFTQQTDLLREELEANAARVLAAKKQGGIDSVTEDRTALQISLEELQASRLNVQSELAAAEARVESMRAALSRQSQEKSNAILDPAEYKKLQAALRLEEAAQAALAAQNRAIGSQLDRLRTALQTIEKNEPTIRRLQREQELLEEKYRTYSENREQARINQELETRKISNVTIVQNATQSDEANPSGKLIKMAAALFLGFFGAIGLAFGFDCIDPSLHSETDVSIRLHRETLVELPQLRGRQLDAAYRSPLRKERKARWILHSGKNTVTDGESCFQELCLRFLSAGPDASGAPPVIGLTSSVGGEGVSTVAGKLAAAFSRDDRFPQVLLLDANLTEHSVRLIRKRTDLPFTYETIRRDEAAEGDEAPVNASTVARYLAEARRKPYDIIIVDIPPVEEGNYTVRVAAEADCVGLLADCGRTPWRIVERSAELLDRAGVHLCGIILNRQQYTMPKWLYRKL